MASVRIVCRFSVVGKTLCNGVLLYATHLPSPPCLCDNKWASRQQRARDAADLDGAVSGCSYVRHLVKICLDYEFTSETQQQHGAIWR